MLCVAFFAYRAKITKLAEPNRPADNPSSASPSFAYRANEADEDFLAALRKALLRAKEGTDVDTSRLVQQYSKTSFPKNIHGLALTLYQPGLGRQRSIAMNGTLSEYFSKVTKGISSKDKLSKLDLADNRLCRIQVDFILNPPSPFDFLSAIQSGDGPKRSFEMGIDGLWVQSDKKNYYFMPGDAYTKSTLSMGQLKRHIGKRFKDTPLNQLKFYLLRTESFISYGNEWLKLYRGYPLVGELSKEKLERAVRRGIEYVVKNQKKDGTFLYYYDAALDSFVDEEHPNRDPNKNPYYNILRHSGGGLLLLYDFKLSKNKDLIPHVQSTIDYLITKIKMYKTAAGEQAGYIYDVKKAKLGGTGIALYLFAEYQHLTGDTRYEKYAQWLNAHLLNQIMPSGEFYYYHIYLDKKIETPEENKKLFNFYYPGEAMIGLATYYKYCAKETVEKEVILQKMKSAFNFLLVERPALYKPYYTTLPSDSWLMMAINEAWDIEGLKEDLYKEFVFQDADKMVSLMYTKENAPYPDYPGSFYYFYGDFPYADGARAEGLNAALELAVKIKDGVKIKKYYEALKLAAWATLHLCNTPESMYFAKNQERAVGGIRFKHTRQWFRIDTIQHVAAFYLKFLPYWKD